MQFSELGRIIESLSKEKSIKKSLLINAIEQAFLVTARKKFGIQGDYESRYNSDDDEVEVFQYKNVVMEVRDPVLEINLDMAKGFDQEVEVGDQLGVKIENLSFTRMDIQTVKQIIFQKVRDEERKILFAEFKHREHEIITGIARRYERGNVIVDLGKADAILRKREMISGENFQPGDRIQAYLTEVVMTHRGPEIRLSRTSPLFLVKLFELEVPEIQDGTIEIRSVAREPGQRAKVAVISTDKDIDPIGPCVGMKGARVQNVVNELQGEKIDVALYSPEIEQFAREALKPAEISNIMLDLQGRSMDVVIEEEELSKAIGRRGQNVRLAAILTGFKINIISKTKLHEKIEKAVENLLQLKTVSEAKANVFVQSGVMSIGDLVAKTNETIQEILEISATDAGAILTEICDRMDGGTIVLEPEEEEELISASAKPAYQGSIDKQNTFLEDDENKFSDAERRLREELVAFKLK